METPGRNRSRVLPLKFPPKYWKCLIKDLSYLRSKVVKIILQPSSPVSPTGKLKPWEQIRRILSDTTNPWHIWDIWSLLGKWKTGALSFFGRSLKCQDLSALKIYLEHGVKSGLWKVKPSIKSWNWSPTGQVDSYKLCSCIINHRSNFVYVQLWSFKWNFIKKNVTEQNGLGWDISAAVMISQALFLTHKIFLTPEGLTLTTCLLLLSVLAKL